MKKTQAILMTFYTVLIVATLLLVVLCETGVLETGLMATNKEAEFITATTMELITLGGVFFALRLFKFGAIHQQLVTRKAPALLQFGLVRLVMIEAMMLFNTLFYYMYMNTTFGYMAIMQLLCLPFVCPTMSRCIDETTPEGEEKTASEGEEETTLTKG